MVNCLRNNEHQATPKVEEGREMVDRLCGSKVPRIK